MKLSAASRANLLIRALAVPTRVFIVSFSAFGQSAFPFSRFPELLVTFDLYHMFIGVARLGMATTHPPAHEILRSVVESRKTGRLEQIGCLG